MAGTVLLCTVLAFFIRSSDGDYGWANVVNSDGRGYFAYLATFVKDGNLSFDYVKKHEQAKYSPEYAANYIIPLRNGGKVNKYFPGVAGMISPFFFTAMGLEYVFHGEINPYGIFGQVSVFVAALFYLTLGLWFFYKLLVLIIPHTKSSWLFLPVVLFGTSLFQYTVGQPAMSHVYSFCAVNGFLYFLAIYGQSRKTVHLILCSICLTVILLIRPTNVLVLLLVPLVFPVKNWSDFRVEFISIGRKWIIPFAVLSAGIVLQLLVIRVQTGDWFTWLYRGEGFYFGNPQMLNVLFSFKRGLLVYTPVLLFLIPGMVFLYKAQKWRFWYLLIFFVANIYLISSWWSWYYGDGFGHRAFIDFYAVYFIPVVFFFEAIRQKIGVVLKWFGVIAFTLLTAVQNYQYHVGILHSWDMDAEKYGAIFLKTNKIYSGTIRGSKEVPLYGELAENAFFAFDTNYVASGKEGLLVAQGNEFPCGIEIRPTDSLRSGKVYFQIQVDYAEPKPNAANELSLVVDIQNAKGESVRYESMYVKSITTKFYSKGASTILEFSYYTIPSESDLMKVYLWNREKQSLVINRFKVDVRSIREID